MRSRQKRELDVYCRCGPLLRIRAVSLNAEKPSFHWSFSAHSIFLDGA